MSYIGRNRQISRSESYTKQQVDDLVKSTGLLLAPQWIPSRDNISTGYAAADGQLLSRDTYPKAWEAINLGLVPTCTEADWTNDPSNRGCFTVGDGRNNFRVPDYNGVSGGSHGAIYLTGDGLKTAGQAGRIRADQMQQITGEWDGSTGVSFGVDSLSNMFVPPEGALSQSGDPVGTRAAAGSDNGGRLKFDSADSPNARTADHTHGTDVSGVWVIRLFGTVANAGSADATQLATDYANLAGRVTTIESKPPLGWDQTWQDVTASRSKDVTYTNSTGTPIYITVKFNSNNSSNDRITVDGIVVSEIRLATGGSSTICLNAFVPSGSTYIFEGAYSTITIWSEFR